MLFSTLQQLETKVVQIYPRVLKLEVQYLVLVHSMRLLLSIAYLLVIQQLLLGRVLVIVRG